jgi:hypothetical protein
MVLLIMEVTMSGQIMPKALPEDYRNLWEALHEMDVRIGSRQKLASALKVSTHSIQRILVDGDVPDMGGSVSRRQKLAWARTLVRLSFGLDLDPLQLLRKTGFVDETGLDELVESEMIKMKRDAVPASEPSIALARVLSSVLDREEVPAGDSVRRALENFIDINQRMIELRASDDDLASGSFCASCLAHLEDPSRSYCRWCGDENGNLRSRDQVLEIVTDWFMSWQRDIDRNEARRRAESYMNAMPAWN